MRAAAGASPGAELPACPDPHPARQVRHFLPLLACASGNAGHRAQRLPAGCACQRASRDAPGAIAVRFNVPRGLLAPRMAVAGPPPSASADPAAAGHTQAAKDTATTSSVPASSLAGTATQPPANPAERTLRGISSAGLLPLLRAKATGKAGRKLIAEARNESAGNGIPPASPDAPPRHAHPRARSRPTGTPPCAAVIRREHRTPLQTDTGHRAGLAETPR
jgi:hypothetical protein